MKTIGYYISDYGYGHATRSIAVIRELFLQAGEPIRLIVCSGRALAFIRQSLKAYQQWIEYREISTDLGYFLKSGSIEPDMARLQVEYERYLNRFADQVEQEKLFLQCNNVKLVISDISPIPIEAAHKGNIVSIGISNFTWYTAYEEMMDEHRLEPIYAAYRHMDYFIGLSGAKEPQWGRLGSMRTGFFCRKPDGQEAMNLRKSINPDGSKIIVYFALGMSIQVDDLEEMAMWGDDDCIFIVSSNMDAAGANVIPIPDDYMESQNYLAISDLVISKPGWGTVGEAVCLHKPLLLLSRHSFPEDRHTMEALKGIHPYLELNWAELKRVTLSKAFIGALQAKDEFKPAMEPNTSVHDLVKFLIPLLT